MRSVPDFRPECRSGFHRIADAFLSQPGLPFTQLLSAERIERVFAEHGNLFGGTVYSTALMVWSFLGQVLRDGKEASCQAAVARIVAHQQQIGGAIPTADTGDYCRARAKLSKQELHALTVEVGAEAEQEAQPAWLWKGVHAKLVDGLTFTMPDTPANQAAYPQPSSQKRGVGFPMARACAILSLATACLLDAAEGRVTRQAAAADRLLRNVPIRARDMVAVFDGAVRGMRPGPLPRVTRPNRRMRSRQPPRPHRTSRTQAPPARLQTNARTTHHSPRPTRANITNRQLTSYNDDSAIR